jgi:hypothetical protein
MRFENRRGPKKKKEKSFKRQNFNNKKLQKAKLLFSSTTYVRSCAPFFKVMIAFTTKQPNNRIKFAQRFTTTN